VQNDDIILVSKLNQASRPHPRVQGRKLQVFPLNFVDAAEVQKVVTGLLSPVGQIFISQSAPADRKKTQELVVVEDVPESIERVAEYIAQVDQPPRQVMIEAHVLQVELKDEHRHGIDWSYLTTISGQQLALSTQGFTNPLATPGAFFTFDGDKLKVLLEVLKTTTDTKTLASPKVMVANGQEAKIQIGNRFGYFVTTTTQTSTLQNVNFLDTGVVLRVTPQISADNQVLMTVKPEVSSGKISPAGLPETETTQAETSVLLPNEGGMVIGGLIKELDTETQEKVPVLGDLRVVGRLFQKRAVRKQRSEIIIALVPRIAPFTAEVHAGLDVQYERAVTPLLHGALDRYPRPWEPILPDAIDNPRNFRPRRVPDAVRSLGDPQALPIEHYFPAASDELPPWSRPHKRSR
jgi:type II secretory pathway component GspD/PulD (secretin)